MVTSIQGDFTEVCASTSGSPAISMARMPWVQVVPDLGGVETTISPARGTKASQRELSVTKSV